ncbi:hypothetical protein QBC42DRAFT_258080 [Cladorrhinum samala]|uniref:Uncharacterized protein n=1 Tax=Cladorrhinum samala TaxID=585594 RepID=A0AAV9I560_9PEZI|nr:hypothetical protein QBC42DRAFT_258080 [Cladorrhinum samala]
MGAFPSETADDKEAYWPASRNAGLEKAWSMNPDGFTLMTACSADEIAQEKKGPDGKSYGAFTYHLVEALKNMAPNAPLPSYRLLSDKITKAILGDQLQQQQTPHVYGRDRLAFLETYEAFIAAPIVSTVKDGALVIPTGRFHAVYPGSEFKLGYPWHDTVLRVSGIDKWKCLAKPLRGSLPSRLDSTPQVVPSKWGLGEEKFRAFVDKRLGDSFRKELEKHLKELLAGSVEVVAASEADILNQDVYGLLLHPGQNKIDILAPSEVAGRQGEAEETKPDKSLVSVTASKKQANKFNAKARIPGFTFPGHDGLQLVPKCGIALANLARFKQVLVDMPKMASDNYEPFEWKLDPVGRPKDRKWSFNFQNTGHTELRVTVLSLTPGFAVNQFWPSDSPHWLVPQGKKIPPFALTMGIPKELRGVNDKLSLHRDILRVMVTDGEGCSWRCLELPEIWQVDAIAQNARNRESTGRNPGMAPSDPQWWINDIEVYTSSRAS